MGQPGSKRTPEASRDICPEAGMVCKGIVDFVLTSQTITLVQLYNLLLSMHFISPHEKKMLQKSYDDTTIAGILAGTPISLLYLAVGVWYIIQWLLFESLEAPCMGGNTLDLWWSKASLKCLSKSKQNLKKLQEVGLTSHHLHAPLHQASGIKSGYPSSFCPRSTV